MFKAIFGLAFLLAGLAATARANPGQGSNELRLNGSTTFSRLSTSGDASGAWVFAPAHGDNTTALGASLGFGHFVTAEVEIGGSLGLSRVSGGGNTESEVGAGPFLKILRATGRAGFFFEASALYGEISTGNGNATSKFWDLGVDLGLEAFATEHWSLRIGPGFHRLIPTDSGSNVTVLGIGWAISAYF